MLTGQRCPDSCRSTSSFWSNADWARWPDSCRSTSSFCVATVWCPGPPNGKPPSHSPVRRPKYRVVAHVVAECCWLRQLLQELHVPLQVATVVYCDNINAVYMIANPVHHRRTKHIEIDIHFVREKVALGEVRVLHVSSKYQFADVMTKGLPVQLFEDFPSSLCLRIPDASTVGG